MDIQIDEDIDLILIDIARDLCLHPPPFIRAQDLDLTPHGIECTALFLDILKCIAIHLKAAAVISDNHRPAEERDDTAAKGIRQVTDADAVMLMARMRMMAHILRRRKPVIEEMALTHKRISRPQGIVHHEQVVAEMPLLRAEVLPLWFIYRFPCIIKSGIDLAHLIIRTAVAIVDNPLLVRSEDAAPHGCIEQRQRHLVLAMVIELLDFLNLLERLVYIHSATSSVATVQNSWYFCSSSAT